MKKLIRPDSPKNLITIDQLSFDSIIAGTRLGSIFYVHRQEYKGKRFDILCFYARSSSKHLGSGNGYVEDLTENDVKEWLMNSFAKEVYQFDSMEEFLEWALNFIKNPEGA